MLKIRRPLGRLIFNMGIAIPGKTVFLIETAPCPKAEIFVTSEDTVPILGLKTCRELGIIEKDTNASVNAVTCDNKPITHEVLNEDYTVAFEGHWAYPGDYRITLIENPECHIDAPKRIAHCPKEPLKQKLLELKA